MESWDAYVQYCLVQSRYKPKIRHYLVDKSNPIELFDDDEFRNRYRLTKEAFHDLLKLCELLTIEGYQYQFC